MKGEALDLVCTVTGVTTSDGTSSIIWYKKGTSSLEMQTEAGFASTYSFSALEHADTGTYYCSVRFTPTGRTEEGPVNSAETNIQVRGKVRLFKNIIFKKQNN